MAEVNEICEVGRGDIWGKKNSAEGRDENTTSQLLKLDGGFIELPTGRQKCFQSAGLFGKRTIGSTVVGHGEGTNP